MDIGKTDGVGGPGRVDGPNKITRITPPVTPSGASASDKVDLSQKASMVAKALSLPDVRAERMAEIKQLIESGRFETDARLQGALDRFMVENSDL